jgi:hypothetical protein
MIALLLGIALAGGPPPQPDRGVVEARARVSLDGRSYSPLSLVGALLGWNSLGVALDVGAARRGSTTLSLGGELTLGKPFAAEALGSATFELADGVPGSFWMFESGLVGKLTAARSDLKVLTPYACAFFGPAAYRFGVRARGGTGASYRTGALRTGLGAGMNGTFEDGWFVGGELRYLVSFRLRAREDLVVDVDGSPVTYVFTGIEHPARGFSWVFSVGRRFR